jgi:hypothetical protein
VTTGFAKSRSPISRLRREDQKGVVVGENSREGIKENFTLFGPKSEKVLVIAIILQGVGKVAPIINNMIVNY